MMATDLALGPANPGGVWKSDATTNLEQISRDELLRFSVHVKDTVEIKEAHFTAYYSDWSEVPHSVFPADFPEDQIWRILAICKPSGGTPGCSWDGTVRSADVAFHWNP